jgi:hypothetical protein
MSIRLLRFIALCMLLLVSGCATTPDSTQRSYFDQQAATARQSPAAMVVDGCVFRDEIGIDYVLRNASQDIGKKSADAASHYLNTNGHTISTTIVPFICGTSKGTEAIFVAEDIGTPTVESQLPIPLVEQVRENPDLSKSYRELLVKVAEAIAADSKESLSRQGKSTSLGLTMEQVEILKRDVGGDQVWVLLAGGAQVSTAKSVGVGTLTTVLSLALSGGTYVYMSTATDGYGYDVALLNLGTNQIIWKKSVKGQPGDPADTKIYTAEWAKNIFDPFILATNSVATTADVQASARKEEPTVFPQPEDKGYMADGGQGSGVDTVTPDSQSGPDSSGNELVPVEPNN